MTAIRRLDVRRRHLQLHADQHRQRGDRRIVLIDDNGTPGNTGRRLLPDLRRRRHRQQLGPRLGETWTYSRTKSVAQAMLVQFTNIVTRHGRWPQASCRGHRRRTVIWFGARRINIEKFVSGDGRWRFAAGPTSSPTATTLTNTGNAAIGGIVLVRRQRHAGQHRRRLLSDASSAATRTATGRSTSARPGPIAAKASPAMLDAGYRHRQHRHGRRHGRRDGRHRRCYVDVVQGKALNIEKNAQ